MEEKISRTIKNRGENRGGSSRKDRIWGQTFRFCVRREQGKGERGKVRTEGGGEM